ncbi:RNA polymerase sigma factor [Streptomyces sp. SS]|uniref:RNA polymerase sigma factor n=1 Tax=Streptomyces sp. SS TaxID=260742 RepID=UPI001ED993A2|nr:sigma-70 family RNA polymerase sigma factor [Streptomyces sp. SS]
MGLIDADHVGLVVAAQAGDDRAREELIAAYLPLVYNIVGRALSGHADVDDVVQETLLRVVRDLPDLRAPESFRSWLVSITLRQINTHWHRQHVSADRTTVIDEARQIPDAGAEPVDTAILRLHVSDERRRVVEAGRWLDPDHRGMRRPAQPGGHGRRDGAHGRARRSAPPTHAGAAGTVPDDRRRAGERPALSAAGGDHRRLGRSPCIGVAQADRAAHT